MSCIVQDATGLLLVVSGPSGVGKGAVCREITKNNDRMRLSVSATTRPMRAGEVDGVNYFYKTGEEFEQMVKNGEFLEYAPVYDNFYGTPLPYVKSELVAGRDVVLEIDVIGALNVKKLYPSAVSIFIAPPSTQELKSRLIGRASETPEQLELRFGAAKSEMQCMNRYDYVIVNDVVEFCAARIETIAAAERMRAMRNEELIESLLEA